jgi:DNA-binding transcriptional ArsR family regulator
VTDDDRVFKALADPTRRFLLDRLFVRDGRTLTELESELEMTRLGVMKHLRTPEEAGLVVVRRSGREKLHFLNPVPIRLIHDRWIDKYTERQVSAGRDHEARVDAAVRIRRPRRVRPAPGWDVPRPHQRGDEEGGCREGLPGPRRGGGR